MVVVSAKWQLAKKNSMHAAFYTTSCCVKWIGRQITNYHGQVPVGGNDVDGGMWLEGPTWGDVMEPCSVAAIALATKWGAHLEALAEHLHLWARRARAAQAADNNDDY